jgi:Lon protease-like protein
LNQIIPLFPLSHGIFPDGKLHLQIFEVRYLNLIKQCHQQQLPFGVVQLINNNEEVQVPGQVPTLHEVGCLAHIREFDQVQPAFFRIVCQGGLRFQLTDLQPGPYGVWQGAVTYLPQDPELAVPSELQILADKMGKIIASLQKQGKLDKLSIFAPYYLDQCGWLANRYAEAMPVSTEMKQQLLKEPDPQKRLQDILQLSQLGQDDD